MPYISYNGGLTIKSPTSGTENYEQTMRTDTYTKISQHDHTGNGRGTQLGTASFANDSISDIKVRLRNNQPLRARNAANNADINILKVNLSDIIEILGVINSRLNVTLANNQSSAITTGLPTITEKGAILKYNVMLNATAPLSQSGTVTISFNGSTYDLAHEFNGDANIRFSIVSGVIKYTSGNETGFVSSLMNYSLLTLGA